MRVKSLIPLLLGILLLAFLLTLAFLKESAVLLYAASAVPLAVVPFLPVSRSAQLLVAGRSEGIHIYLRKTGAEEADIDAIVIRFRPGAIKWNRKVLYFQAENLPLFSSHEEEQALAAITVLPFDLFPHPHKKGYWGIRLHNLTARTAGQPFSLKDVSRLIIRSEGLPLPLRQSPDSLVSPPSRKLQA
jgi:hypothetical protein